jgi:hypothetical protein
MLGSSACFSSRFLKGLGDFRFFRIFFSWVVRAVWVAPWKPTDESLRYLDSIESGACEFQAYDYFVLVSSGFHVDYPAFGRKDWVFSGGPWRHGYQDFQMDAET